jgi:plastocyanin
MTAKITITAAESGGNGTATGGPPAGPTINILVGSVTQGAPDYDPDTLTVKKGDKVNVVNQDTTLHTVTNGEGTQDPNSAKLFDTKFMESKATAIIDTANLDPASYAYYCQVHPYMTGTLVVE